MRAGFIYPFYHLGLALLQVTALCELSRSKTQLIRRVRLKEALLID